MQLRDVMKRYGIRFKKGLGQNLLLDDNINRIMTEAAALTTEDSVVEVGAGLGALTRRLCEQAGCVLAVEIDPSFMPCLEDQFGAKPNVRLFRGDILNHELDKLLDEYFPGKTSWKMVSNLPYYITTPVLFHFFESGVDFRRIVVMVQEEVALRLSAVAGSKAYGVLSLAAQQYARVDIVHKAPRTCFAPQPNVDSCIVRFRCHEEPLFPDLERKFLMRVIRTAFSQRRKTLRNSIGRPSAFGLPREVVLDAMEEAGTDPQRRPETLALDDFARLALALSKRSPEEAPS